MFGQRDGLAHQPLGIVQLSGLPGLPGQGRDAGGLEDGEALVGGHRAGRLEQLAGAVPVVRAGGQTGRVECDPPPASRALSLEGGRRPLGELAGRRRVLRRADQGEQRGPDRFAVAGRLEVGHQLTGPAQGLVVARHRLPPLVLDADAQHDGPLAGCRGVGERVREQLVLAPLVEILQLQRHPVQGRASDVLIRRGGLRQVAAGRQPPGQQSSDLVAVHLADGCLRGGEVPLDVGRQGRLGVRLGVRRGGRRSVGGSRHRRAPDAGSPAAFGAVRPPTATAWRKSSGAAQRS